MKIKILVAVFFLAILGIGVGLFLYHKPAERVVQGEAKYAITAENLFREFTTDEVQANRRYLNSIVRVKGIVADLSYVDSLGYSLVLAANDSLFGVSCQFARSADLSQIKSGDTVSVKGLCTGKLMDVVLVRCVLESK